MSDETRKDPKTEPGSAKAVTGSLNLPTTVEVKYDEFAGTFSYVPATGNVVIHRRIADPAEFTIYLKRAKDEAWDFVSGGFTWRSIGGAPQKTPNNEDVLTPMLYESDRITIKNLVEYEGPYNYKYQFKIKLHSSSETIECPDPEIQNNKEIQASPSVTEH